MVLVAVGDLEGVLDGWSVGWLQLVVVGMSETMRVQCVDDRFMGQVGLRRIGFCGRCLGMFVC